MSQELKRFWGLDNRNYPRMITILKSRRGGIKQLLDNLGINKLYLGSHDFGGPVSLTLMRMFPDLSIKGLSFRLQMSYRLGMWMMYQAATKEKTQASWEKFELHLTPSGINYTRRIFQRSLSDLKTNYQLIEGSTLKIYEHTGHFVPEEQPSSSRVIFWTSLETKRDNVIIKL